MNEKLSDGTVQSSRNEMHVPAVRLRAGSAGEAAPRLALPWVLRLRYGMVFSGAVILLVAAPILRIHLAVLLWALLPLGLMLVSNVWLDRARRSRAEDVQRVLGSIFVFDTLCLTVVLGLTGGPMNPFSLLYLVQITLSVVVLKKEWTWVLGILSAVCFGAVFFLNAPLDGMRVMPAEHGMFPHLVGMWVSFVVAALLISFFTGRVSDALRLREQEVLRLQDKVARQERLTSLGTLAAGAAHELGTPLGTIAIVVREIELYAATLQSAEELGAGELGEDAKLIRAEVERCQRILKRMSAEGAELVGESPRMIGVGELLELVLGQVAVAQRARVVIEVTDAEAILSLPVEATVQSLAVLVGNAFDASGDELPVMMKAECDGREITLSICDSGCGMDEEALRRVAEPFFTTKEPGQGMGLGTFLVRTFAERLGGNLAYRSAPGRGTVATLRLPMRLENQPRGVRASG